MILVRPTDEPAHMGQQYPRCSRCLVRFGEDELFYSHEHDGNIYRYHYDCVENEPTPQHPHTNSQ